VGEPIRLNDHQRRALATPSNYVAVSSTTAWEIAIKVAIGRLSFPLDQFDYVMQRMGFATLPILPIPRDPGGLFAATPYRPVRPDADCAGDGRKSCPGNQRQQV
jgi:PIN domain nuclease of toxin-antitoxin system